MTLDDRVRKQLGDMVVEILALQEKLETAQARIAELEKDLKPAPPVISTAEDAPRLYAAG